MISPEEFIDYLEQKDLLPAKLLASLRRQLAETKVPVSAAFLAKRLVESGHLSHRLAQRLLEQAQTTQRPSRKPQVPLHRGPKPSDDLDLAPLDDTPPPRSAKPASQSPKPAPPAARNEDDLIPLDEELAPLEEAVPPPADYGVARADDEELIPVQDSDQGPSRSVYGLTPPDNEPIDLLPIDASEPELASPQDLVPLDELAPLDELVPLDDLVPLDEPKPAPKQRPISPSTPAPVPPPPKPRPQSSSTPATAPAPVKPPQPSRPKARAGGGGQAPSPTAALSVPLDLEGDSPAAPVGDLLQELPEEKASGTSRVPKSRPRGNVWDSPLLLLGGGALLGLLILLGALLWAVLRQSGDALVKIADDNYSAGAYTKAIEDYNRFLEKTPNHPKATEARVRRGLAQMRQITDGTSSWSTALATTKTVLTEISREPNWRSVAQPELAAMLPKIAEGLANQARKQPKEELVQQAEETLGLVEKYINKDVRPEAKLADIRASLALTRRDISRGNRLEKSVGDMKTAVAAGKTPDAYLIRNALLKEYPDLAGNDKLVAAVLAASQAEQAAVKHVAQEQLAGKAALPASTTGTVALARRQTSREIAAAKGWVVCALAGGAAYGLDAATGKVLWRRLVGFGDNGRSPSFPPTPVADAPGSDLVLVDALHNAVIRLRASTGEPVWQFSVGEPFDAHPAIVGNQLWIATRSGRLLKVSLESGASSDYFQFPEELRVGPAVDLQHSALFQVAEHSNLFVISLADNRCTRVLYLGHEPGTILFPPAILGRLMVLARSDDSQSTDLNVFAIDSDKDGPKLKPLQTLRLKGRITAAPLVSDRRLLAITDKGEMSVLEATDVDPNRPLNLIAQGVAGNDENVVRFPLLLDEQFFLGDNQLTHYDILASRNRIEPRWNVNPRSATLQPLRRIGSAIVQVRRKDGLPGVIVSAVDPEEGKPLWDTHLAAKLVSEPSYDVSADVLSAVTSSGGLFELKAADLGANRVLDVARMGIAMAEVRQSVHDAVRLDPQVLAMVMGNAARDVTIFRTAELRSRQLPLPDALGGPTVAMAGALVTPLEIGEVFLLDPTTGEKQTEAFQPAVQPGTSYAWQRPVVLSPTQLLVSEGKSVYRLAFRKDPKPTLAQEASLELAKPVISPPAVAGNTGFIMTGDNVLVSFSLPELKKGPGYSLQGRVVWGPWTAADRVLVASNDQLLSVDANQKQWQVALAHGPPVGVPLVDGQSVLVASASGTIARIDLATGKELGKRELGMPLATGPVLVKDQLVLGGSDGSLYQTQKP